MPIKQLFKEAQNIIALECLTNNNPDLHAQYEIIRTQKYDKLLKESDILNCLVVQASSYSVVRKFFKVLYAEDIYRFDQYYSSHFFNKAIKPDYLYEDWIKIVLFWGNNLLVKNQLPQFNDIYSLIKAMDKAEREGIENLNSLKPIPRIVFSLATALPNVKKEILLNPTNFYTKADGLSSQYPGRAFDYAENFSKDIKQMGTVLVCNFFKELGLLQYVKVDVHVKDFLENLNTDCKKLNPKRNFILSWLLAKEAGMEPFFLDKILYVGGKYVKPKIKALFNSFRNEYENTLNRLISQIPNYY
jgi:hypothetical protein